MKVRNREIILDPVSNKKLVNWGKRGEGKGDHK